MTVSTPFALETALMMGVVAVSHRLLSSVNSFTLYGNPLHCDCRLHWILTDQCYDAKSVCSRHLVAGNQTRCAGPEAAAGLALLEGLARDRDHNTSTCGPTVTVLFDPVMCLPTASTIRLDCRITEQTWRSSVVWITPGRRRRLYVERSSTGSVLIIRHLEARDAGTYRCLVVDADNSSSATNVLRQYNLHARVLPLFVRTTSVMITWSGTDSTFAAADYVIVYRLLPVCNHSDQTALETDRGMIQVRPYLRKYTR